jgi:pimeloyl-ACP methyl ester carboxylesterase
MGGAPTTSVITIDGHAIEYRLERREPAAVLILHGGHISARCRFGEETFLELSDRLRAPTDVSNDVAQPTLLLATRNDGAVSFDHAEYLVATLPHATLVEVDTPTHLLWLGGGSDRTAAETASFITT